MSLRFWSGLHCIGSSLWPLNQFYNVKSSNRKVQDVFSFSCIFFNFFYQCFVVFSVKSFTSLVTFIPKYVIFFATIVNGIVFSISFWTWVLLVYKNVTDLCVDFVSYHITECVYYSSFDSSLTVVGVGVDQVTSRLNQSGKFGVFVCCLSTWRPLRLHINWY